MALAMWFENWEVGEIILLLFHFLYLIAFCLERARVILLQLQQVSAGRGAVHDNRWT